MVDLINNKNTYLKVQSDDFKKEYLEYLKDYAIKYRDRINLPKEYTFGIEIEYDNYPEPKFEKIINERYKRVFNSQTELDMANGGEVSSKIMNDRKYCWNNITYILNELKAVGAKSTDMCGAHVHTGAHVLGNDINKWKNFLYLYIVYEPIIYRFATGEDMEMRPLVNAKAYPSAIDLANNLDLFEQAHDVEDIGRALDCDDRFRGLNVNNIMFRDCKNIKERNTIEFRMANGTLNPVVWQNLINCYLKLLYTSSNKEIDLDYLKYRIESIKEKGNYSGYNNIYLDDAFEFVDEIFDNNIDKNNFMKQYIK